MANPLTPPNNELVLQAPQPVQEVEPEEAFSILPSLSKEAEAQAQSKAVAMKNEIVSLQPKSPEFQRKIQEIQRLASDEINNSTSSSRLLQSKSTSMVGSKKSGDNAQIKVANTLAELRSTVDDLAPNPGDLSPARKILGIIPFGNNIAKYFQKYETAEVQIDAIIKSLMHGQDELYKDNAAMETEKARLWDTMGKLGEAGRMVRELDTAVSQEIATLKNQGQVEKANILESDVLFTVRQRHQDILTQAAVSVQSYLAMGLIQQNNNELIKGVERSRTTTVEALRTAVMTASALSTQKLVLNQIDALNTTTNNMIELNASMLKEQTGLIQKQAASSGVSADSLEKAFNSIYETLDSVDTFKAQANAAMEQTVHALENQIVRTKPYVDRARQQEIDGGNASAPQQITR